MAAKAPARDENTASAGYEIYIMRHGLAEGIGSGITEDAKRTLTPEGKKKMQDIAHGLARLGWVLDWIVTSPLVRAVETAHIVSGSFASEVPVEISDALRPAGSADALISLLAKHPNRNRVLVVGHEPDLSALAARLIGSGRGCNLAFKKGGCCLIACDGFPLKSPGQLVWWLTPRVMRKLA